jgi:YVTN family beta-propeller protein
MIDMETWQVVRTVKFPDGSQPYMLRVSPDGKEVWVQTASADTNVVLSADDLSTLSTQPGGRTPVRNSWTPDARYSLLLSQDDTDAIVFDAKTYGEVSRLPIGQGGANVGYTKDGSTAFIAVAGSNSVAVIDLPKLSVESQIRVGSQPQGLIVL